MTCARNWVFGRTSDSSKPNKTIAYKKICKQSVCSRKYRMRWSKTFSLRDWWRKLSLIAMHVIFLTCKNKYKDPDWAGEYWMMEWRNDGIPGAYERKISVGLNSDAVEPDFWGGKSIKFQHAITVTVTKLSENQGSQKKGDTPPVMGPLVSPRKSCRKKLTGPTYGATSTHRKIL